ncbi:hypothetical protein Q3G72_030595 [Acer saccharum]|nr:hypothetical protein Q3G72_030595 [Acer saccharum]
MGNYNWGNGGTNILISPIVITKSDTDSKSSLPFLMSLNIYVPRDERFGQLKISDFLAYALKSIFQYLKSSLEAIDSTPFQDVLKLYEGGADLPNIVLELLEQKFNKSMAKSSSNFQCHKCLRV